MVSHDQLPRVERLFRLDGRTALVTGAAGHLGRAIACALADCGARVYLNGRDASALAVVQAALKDRGHHAEIAAFDVRDTAQVQSFADRVVQNGALDVLVSNAYASPNGSSARQDMLDAYDISVGSIAGLIDIFLPALERAAAGNGDASVIALASMYGKVSPNVSLYDQPEAVNPAHYGAAKAALIQYCRHAGCQLAPKGIRVNSISPGPFPADGNASEAFQARLAKATPLGRIGQPADLMGAVAFLASPASRYVTATDLAVDGGWTAW